MRKTICIVIGLAVAATAASAAQGQQPSPIQRIIAHEDANRMTVLRRQQAAQALEDNTIPGPGNPNPTPGGLGNHPPNPIQVPGKAVSHQTVPASVVVTVDGGFDWGDAGIGGAAGLALALLGVGTVVLVRDGRRQKAHG